MALFTIGPCIGSSSDLTIPEMLSDSIVQALMEDDGIDPEMLKAQLRSIAQLISAARPSATQWPAPAVQVGRAGGTFDGIGIGLLLIAVVVAVYGYAAMIHWRAHCRARP
jgi:hypothetical protein